MVAVCDVDTTRRESAKQMVEDAYAQKRLAGYKGCTAYSDFRELLARKDIDAVCIASPDHWHAIIVVAAAKAKKDIYCEKPLSLTIPEARAMVKAVRKHNRVLQTGSMQRSSPEFYKACMLVRNGRIGKIQQVIVDVGTSSQWCDLPEEADGTGPQLGHVARACPDAGLQLHPQPARNSQGLPGVARTTANTRAAA